MMSGRVPADKRVPADNRPVAATFHFEHCIAFEPENAGEVLRSIPRLPGVFALRGARSGGEGEAQPYLTRATDLRRRIARMLAPPEMSAEGRPVQSKRLNLRARVARIEYSVTGSEFESTLALYHAAAAIYGLDEARRRLRLHTPFFLRFTAENAYPRVYSTNRLRRRALGHTYGPFPSRAAADRYCDAVLDLFKLRRCSEDLVPFPEHPGCVYGEMKKCLAPCKKGNPQACTPEQYAHEAQSVFAFFATRGQSLLDEVATQREAASEAMDFEAAAALHKQWEKVRAAALLADELVRPVDQLRAIVLQEAASHDGDSSTADAAVFLFEHGQIAGPERLSTLGVRAVREQTAVGSSLFAQPLMLSPVPLDPSSLDPSPLDPSPLEAAQPDQPAPNTLTPEDRARAAIEALAIRAHSATDIAELCDHLSLFRRWYYRPERQCSGEVFLPNADGSWPIRRILNGAARVVLGPPTPAPTVDREVAKALKTKIIHVGREGVEREVPILPKRSRTRKSIAPTDIAD